MPLSTPCWLCQLELQAFGAPYRVASSMEEDWTLVTELRLVGSGREARFVEVQSWRFNYRGTEERPLLVPGEELL